MQPVPGSEVLRLQLCLDYFRTQEISTSQVPRKQSALRALKAQASGVDQMRVEERQCPTPMFIRAQVRQAMPAQPPPRLRAQKV